MDKEQETLDMVLDIPNTVSLNPFDRPPNIMDDELNSVTQEELEANLSTDCHTATIDTAPAQNCNDMWEKLIQSFLEDNSTQDAVVQSVNTDPSMFETETETEGRTKEETAEEEKAAIQESLNVVLEEKPMDTEETMGTKEEKEEEKQQENQILEIDSKLYKMEPELDIPAEQCQSQEEATSSNNEEHLLNDNKEEEMLNCLYDLQEDDDMQNDLCQVEVYATSDHENDAAALKNEIDIEDEEDFYENNEDDDKLSNVSAISIGYLEPIDDKEKCKMEIQNEKERLNETHLSTIINDHCYSQEVSVNVEECDVLKQNVINHIMTQNILNKDQQKISKFVDKILNNLDTNKLDLILNTLNATEATGEEQPHEESNIKIENETCSNDLRDKSEDMTTVEEREGELNRTAEIEQESLEETQNPAENELLTNNTLQDNKQTTENIENEVIQATPNIETEESNDNASQDKADSEEISPNEEQLEETEEDLPQTNETNEEETQINYENQIDEENQIIEENQTNATESEEAKSTNDGTLPYNCSEAIEHQICDEEFELLCKNGVLPPKENKTKTDAHTQLLEKLKDFAIQMQKDCEDFSTSTSIENKLHDYIIMQYQNYKELFKPYAVFKQSIETQTTSKKLTKRKRKLKTATNSKTNLSKTSDHSSRYSSMSSSSSSDEAEDNIKSKSIATEEEPKHKTVPPLCSTADYFNSNATNYGHEYDDGINLSKYVQSEIFDIDSLSQQSTMLSDSDSTKEDNDNDLSHINSKPEIAHHGDDDEDDDLGDSDDTMIYKVRSKKSKNSNDSSSVTSAADAQKSNKTQVDNMSVNSESDKENLTSERKEKKSNESMDEDEKNDREIDRLTNISGLTKRNIPNSSSSKGSDKGKPKAAPAKTLSDRFDFMDVEFGSEDEVKSEAEEEVITEQQFLRNCNEDIKRQMLDDSSTDSEALEEEDDELLKASSEEDEEGGTKSPLVEKFLKTYKVDDSDNDIEDNDDDDDDDLDLDTDKEEEEKDKEKENKEENKDNEVLDEDDKLVKSDDNAASEETHTNAEMELLNDNFRIRNYTKPQNLDKMLLEAEKRKKISKIDAELISLSSDSSNSDVEAVDEEPNQKPRSRKPMLRPDQLAGETIKAQKLENERISRLEKKHNMLEKVLKEHPEVDKNKELILDYIKDTKTFIKVHPGIVKYLKPHQFDGVRFMYDSCYGGVDALKKSPGSGCILAHCMGLGKTLQLISLLHTVISYKELKTTKILVLCPKSTVMNWADEIIRWLGPLRQKNVKVYTFSDTSDINEKLSIIKEWSLSNHARAGCLLIGYEAFRTLVCYHSYKNRGNINSERLEEIRLLVNKYLLTPGADLVVCDEGHIIKNSKSAISMAVAKIETPRRIVLTGTPIQNNLKEYYSMVNFIKPLFLGTEKEFANLYANPIKSGQHKDSNKTDIKIMKQRSFVLHKKLSKFVQRKEAELLKTFLPTKFEYVLFIPMTDVQNNLYQHILNAIKNRDENYRGKGLITDYTCLRKIWTHPKVLEDAWKNAINQRNKKETRNKLMGHNSDDDQPDDIYDSQTGQMSVTNDWWRHLVTENDLESVMPSNKLRTMFKILQMCEEKGEKCLIFSAFVAVLNVVEYFFKKISDNDEQILNELKINRNTKWILGHDYYRLDGKTPKSIRHAMINEFNNVNNKTARVFLISAKAGGQGINLIGANRVIILDTSWNPSNDQQNIFRVFRLGQKRSCYIYRLLAMGTMEEKVYSRSVTKQAMSFRVVDEQQIDRHYNMAELAELYTLTIPDNSNRPTPILPQDSILARLLRTFPELVFKYHEHDSLLENKVEQELSEQEKNEAWTAYERDLQMNSEIREMPNIEDFQNKFNPTNLSNYLSFSGLDVSNNQNPSSSKNMSHLLNFNRGFGQNYLQSLLGQNTNAAALNTQQYLDVYNYYKNLGTAYADMNAYSTLPGLSTAGGPGRMPNASTAPSVSTNPLAALGDLSMYGLSSTALQTLGANLPNSLGNSSSAALQQMLNSASMYTSPSALNTNLPITSASNMSAGVGGGVSSASNSAAVRSAFEQFRGSYNNMTNYNDFGLSSTGNTILDSSKSKNSKQGGNSNNKNLPGGSKGGSAMNLFSGPPPYIPSPQPQTSTAQQQQLAQQQRPNSRNTPTYEPPAQQQQQQQKTKSTISTTKSSSSPSTAGSNLMSSSDANSSARAKSLLSYRRTESSSSSSTSLAAANTNNLANASKPTGENLMQNKQNTTQSQRKTADEGANNANNKTMLTPSNTKTMKTPASVLSSNQKSNQKSATNLGSSSSSTTSSSSAKSSNSSTTSSSTNSNNSKSSASAQSDSNRAMNMGILYPNSKGLDKNANKPNSPLNMGIVYPKTSSKSTSEMQIIPTSSPPGTISISKQLNELSPSISLTALKTNTTNKTSTNQNIKTTANQQLNTTQNAQINKIMQQNSNLRRTTSPVNSSTIKATSANLNSSTTVAGTNATTNQSNLLARIKMANSKKPINGNNNNNPVPPLHRASTMINIPTSSTANKSSTGLTITNVKNVIKNPNISSTKSMTSTSQISTLAKQTAAAAVVKSNINRLNSAGGINSDNSTIQKNLNTTTNSPTLPSLATFKRVNKRTTPTVNTVGNKLPALTSSPSLTVTSSNKLPIISSVKSISQYPSTMATISKASITKINTPTNQSSMMAKTSLSSAATTIGGNQPSVTNVSKTLAQMQKRLPTTSQSAATSGATTSSNAVNAIRNTVNIRPVDTKQNPAGTGGVYIIETNINDKKLAIGAPTKSGGGTTVTKVPTQTAIKRKSTDPLSKDKNIETKRLKQ